MTIRPARHLLALFAAITGALALSASAPGHPTIQAASCAARISATGDVYLRPPERTPHLQGPVLCLSNAGSNQSLAVEGIFLFAPRADASPGISKADAEQLARTHAADGIPIAPVHSSALVIWQDTKRGLPPKLAWVIDDTQPCDPCMVYGLGFGTPYPATEPPFGVTAINAEPGDPRLGQIIFQQAGA